MMDAKKEEKYDTFQSDEKKALHLLSKSSVKSESKEEDDPLPLATFSGIDPRDTTAEVTIRGTQGNIYESAKKFEDLKLSKELLDGVYAMKFTKPSKIQADALPVILNEKRQNLIAQAHHGSGKTATYTLGMLSKIRFDQRTPQAVCICPSRELATQIADVVRKLGQYTGVTVCLAVSQSEKKVVEDHVVVGTPGTVQAKLRYRELNPRGVGIFVCDEADVMVLEGSEGMGTQTVEILGKLPQPQVLLFSATFPDKVRKFAMKIAPNAVKIIVKREDLTLTGIKQFYMQMESSSQKFEVLANLYGILNIGQSIIFVHTRQTAKDLCRKMREKGFSVSLLHGADMSAEERDRVMADFKNARTTVLISTNVLSRGIDVLQVTLVVNYDIPLTFDNKPDPTTYIHRIGRSGRFGRKGVAINFVHDAFSKKALGEIANHYAAKISQLPTNDYLKVEECVRDALKGQETPPASGQK